jgi:hypothetical protein
MACTQDALVVDVELPVARRAAAANQHVVAAAALQPVIALAARHQVLALAAIQDIVAATAADEVIATAAIQDVVFGAQENILARIVADHIVGAHAAAQGDPAHHGGEVDVIQLHRGACLQRAAIQHQADRGALRRRTAGRAAVDGRLRAGPAALQRQGTGLQPHLAAQRAQEVLAVAGHVD